MAQLTVQPQTAVGNAGHAVTASGRFASSHSFRAIKAHRDATGNSHHSLSELKKHPLHAPLTTGTPEQ